MYNNYFRLSDGTPTAVWARSGQSEGLTLQELLLQVLEDNHSAPTFRLTGSFINEFDRIGINNYIRITKPGSALVATNTSFTSSLNGWSQNSIPLLSGAWSWVSTNSGSAEVTLSGTDDSRQIYQSVTHSGGYIQITVNIQAVPASSSNTSEDVLWLLFYSDDGITHTEKLTTFAAITSEYNQDFTHTAFAPGAVTRIGFYIKRVAGSGSVTYRVGQFDIDGTDIQEVYQIADYQFDEYNNRYFFELMQLSKTYLTLSDIDKGGSTNGRLVTSGEDTAEFTTDFSLDFTS
jgi:hypothetical protein